MNRQAAETGRMEGVAIGPKDNFIQGLAGHRMTQLEAEKTRLEEEKAELLRELDKR